MKLSCIIVESSDIQRALVQHLISNHQNLNLVGVFTNAIETKNFLSYNTVDLLFLAIEIPVLNAFDFLDTLKIKPQVIFITSKAEYAIKAFEYDATDYLLKPVNPDRFDLAIKKAIIRHRSYEKFLVNDDSTLLIKTKLKKVKIFTSRITFIEGCGDYIKINTDNENFLILSSLKSIENNLPANIFFRVHKSYLVNLKKIDRFNSKIIEIGKIKIPVSRTKKLALQKAILAI